MLLKIKLFSKIQAHKSSMGARGSCRYYLLPNFKDRKGDEYEFENDEEYKMMVEPDEQAPFPDIPAEAPGQT